MPMLMDPRKLAVTLTALLRVAVSLSALPLASAAGPPPYTNHTVGGPAGWFFDPATNSSAANYSSWALHQSFFLGDFLIFRTNTNVSVIQTYNETTYRICDASGDDGASVYSDGSGAGGGFGAPAVVAVPLTEAGDSYYFSDANDGIQCVHGMRFQISVGHGNGLPPDLSRPPPPPYADPTTAPPAGGGTEGTNQREEFHNGGGRKGIGGGGAGMPILVAVMMLLM